MADCGNPHFLLLAWPEAVRNGESNRLSDYIAHINLQKVIQNRNLSFPERLFIQHISQFLVYSSKFRLANPYKPRCKPAARRIILVGFHIFFVIASRRVPGLVQFFIKFPIYLLLIWDNRFRRCHAFCALNSAYLADFLDFFFCEQGLLVIQGSLILEPYVIIASRIQDRFGIILPYHYIHNEKDGHCHDERSVDDHCLLLVTRNIPDSHCAYPRVPFSSLPSLS